MKIRKAVIPAAGLGTRFLPATKAQPKEMLPLVDTPIIQYVIEEAISSGIEDLLIITARGKRSIEDYFDRAPDLENFLKSSGNKAMLKRVQNIGNLANIHYIRQKEPRGLGDAIYQARYHVGQEPFAVMLGDELFLGPHPPLKQLIDCWEKVDWGTLIAVREVPLQDTNRYGIIEPHKIEKDLYRVDGLVEKPGPDMAPSNMAIVGRYIIEPAIFDILKDLPPGKNGEIQLTDALQKLNRISSIYAYSIKGRRFDVGDRLGYLKATIEFALEQDDLRESFRQYLNGLLRNI